MATKEDLYDAAANLFGEGKTDEAIAVYLEALEIDPHYVDALHGLVMAYASNENYERAVAVGKRICELTPDDVLAHTSLSTLFRRLGKMAEANAESVTVRRLLSSEGNRDKDEGRS